MQRYARILVIVCVFLCLTLNYTFPLHRDSSDVSPYITYYNGNHSHCEDLENYKYNTIDAKKRVKRSALGFKVNKKVKHSIPENKENYIDRTSNTENMKNIDLRQYEQLVIMKKYPFLDIKELEMKYHPSGKIVRHSLSFDSGLTIENDPSICEQREELLNVEINNRGLSGFAIPVPTIKHMDTKYNPKSYAMTKSKNTHGVKTFDKYKLENLKQKLLSYLDARNLF